MHNSLEVKYEKLLDEASNWIVRLRSGSASRSDEVEFSKWINQSQSHIHAFDEMSAIWKEMGKSRFILKYSGNPELDKIPPTRLKLNRNILFRFAVCALCMSAVAVISSILVFHSRQKSVIADTDTSLQEEKRSIYRID